MKKSILPSTTAIIALVMLCSFSLSAQNNPAITLIGNLDTKGAVLATLYLNGETEIDYWQKDYIQVEANVTSNNLNQAQLKSLAGMGFFSVKTVGNASGLLLTMNKALPVTINNVLPDNQISFKVTFPNSMAVENGHADGNLLATQ